MAVRFSNSGQNYTRGGTLPAGAGPWTVCCWVKITTDRNTYSTAWSIDVGYNTTWEYLQTGSDGTTMGLDSSSGTQITGPNMTVGSWYFFAASKSGTGTNQAVLYHAIATAASLTTVTGTLGASFTTTTLMIGESPWTNEWLNGCVAGFKLYSAVLTQAEIENERWFYTPQRTANLISWYPFDKAAQTDFSGNAQTLSGGTGATSEDGPPIAWRRGQTKLFIPAAGGGTSVTVSSDTLGGVLSLPSVGFVIDQILSIAAQSSVFSIPSISISSDQILSQTVLPGTLSIVDPTINISVSTTSGVLAGTLSTESVNLLTDQILAISSLNATLTLPVVTVIAGGDVVVSLTTPNTLIAALQTPGIITDAILDVGTQTLTFVLNPVNVSISTPTTGKASTIYIVLGLRS